MPRQVLILCNCEGCLRYLFVDVQEVGHLCSLMAGRASEESKIMPGHRHSCFAALGTGYPTVKELTVQVANALTAKDERTPIPIDSISPSTSAQASNAAVTYLLLLRVLHLRVHV